MRESEEGKRAVFLRMKRVGGNKSGGEPNCRPYHEYSSPPNRARPK